MSELTNYFTELNSVNCTDHVEKKGRFSYLSWPYAVAELKKRHPDAAWGVREWNETPYLSCDAGCFVCVTVKVGEVQHTQWHPVLDSNNKTLKTPSAFDVNTSIQRCLVKAIALHGLGLYIYAGEDLPEIETVTTKPSAAKVEPESEPVTVADMKAKLVEWCGTKVAAKAKWEELTKGSNEQDVANTVFLAKSLEELK